MIEGDKRRLFLGRRRPAEKTAERVVERFEREGIFEWELPRVADNSEFKIKHTLQRRPVGIQRIGGRSPLEFYWTPKQEERWTSSHLYVHVNPWPITGQYTGTIPSSTFFVDVDLYNPVDVTEAHAAWSVVPQSNQGNAIATNVPTPVRATFLNGGSGAAAPPYDAARVAFAESTSGLSVDWDFVATLRIRPQKGWKYRLRVY